MADTIATTLVAMQTVDEKSQAKIEMVSTSPSPTLRRKFRDTNHQAEHASFSRLACCFINEGFMEGVLTEEDIIVNSVALKYAWLRRACQSDRKNLAVGDYIIPLAHSPLHDAAMRVAYIHLEDLGVDAYVIVDSNKNEPAAFALTERFSQNRRLTASYSLNSRILMRSLKWDQPDIAERFCDELENSVSHIEHAFECRNPSPTLGSPVIDWEQSIVEGCDDLFSPRLSFLCLKRDEVTVKGDYDACAGMFFPADTLASLDRQNEVAIPVHPAHLPNVFSRFPQAVMLPGTLAARAQSSVRTVSLSDHEGWSIKLPLGVVVTSAMRTITPWTIHMSLGMVSLCDKLVAASNGLIRILRDVAGVSINHENMQVAKHLSCLIRRDVFHVLERDEVATLGAALPEKDANGVPYVVSAFNLDTHAKRFGFFDNYAKLYLHAFLPPAHNHGFAFEAHGQNILPIFNRTTKGLKSFAVRDFGGIRAHQETLLKTLGEQIDVLPGSCNVVDSLDEVHFRIFHCSIWCHMQEIIRALDLHYSGEGWEIVRRHLKNTIPVDSELYRFFMQPEVDNKCWVKMNMGDLYRESICRRVPNPLLYRSEGGVLVSKKSTSEG